MLEHTYDECKICKEPIKKCYLTEGSDGNYYCAKCLIDLNRKIEYNEILKRRKIGFKVSGNFKIGLGHVYRCINLALRLIDHEIYFFLNEKENKEATNIIAEFFFKTVKYEDNDELIKAEFSGNNISSFSIPFLKAILKIAPITEKLEISLKADHPIKLFFDLLDGAELLYWLAPRVEEADFDEEDEGDYEESMEPFPESINADGKKEGEKAEEREKEDNNQ